MKKRREMPISLANYLNPKERNGYRILNTSLTKSWKRNADNMEKSRLEYIRKNGSKIRKNYRPITTLNAIYKITESIMSNKISPYVTLLTNETQREYKGTKSTTDAIFPAGRNLVKRTVNVKILLDLSKEFDIIG